MFGARFDDVASGESFALTDPAGTLGGDTLEDMTQVTAEVSSAAAAGN